MYKTMSGNFYTLLKDTKVDFNKWKDFSNS